MLQPYLGCSNRDFQLRRARRKQLQTSWAAWLLLALVWGCDSPPAEPERLIIGEPVAAATGFAEVVDADARVEVLAEGYAWSEGPVWVGGSIGLLYSDVPGNTIHRWHEADGASVWLTPSGDTDGSGGGGSNGLTLDAAGRLILAQHGDRRIARLEAPWDNPASRFETLTDSYDDRPYNSPNDLVFGSDGSLYFTDPPYGLESPSQSALGFMGVYRLGPSGNVSLIDSTLTRPNGIALSPDESVLYVANSDPEQAMWVAYDLSPEGTVSGKRVFADATASVGQENPGLPDGLKVDTEGRLFATGPGGVWVLDKSGAHLGTIRTDGATANVAFGEDGSTLFLTSNRYLARINTRTKGLGF